ncbi:rhomboid family intramembrane serine protease [Streptomonospora sp. NEAU-YY374]|uniref:Membrane associated rhomboid family serine protease n=2 Tax=Streptomonospora nanhaiensis TaxID=1323731 RepID=A0A853BRD0_9ACTN|nr:rhomboid family intramembrane serine protease [Streptomonospora nanhaiensis]MBV2362251.1 rhomboid family intramembrane serine protease [Streptomonospora nanhaiensis]MBX9387843.1 rhomboid family intramembrane serine protease [Streptomonospora nanhaiensis]NYI97295.1 membrane associated rhomboid family serine protease [Streptomonospora nanhaiensis]
MTHSRIVGFLTVAAMLVAMWVLEIVDTVLGGALDAAFGLRSWVMANAWSVLTYPFMHADFNHLIGNSVPFLVLGSLVAFSGLGRFVWTTLIVMVVSGIGVWLFTPEGALTVGASGLVFGYFGYTVLRGIVERRTVDIVIMICVVVFYGSLIWGVLPQQEGISWQGHLFGFIGGLFAAYILPRRRRRPAAAEGYGSYGTPGLPGPR